MFLIILTGVGLLVYYGQWDVRRGELYYSGTVEATQSRLAFQTGGRILAVEVREGQAVAKDQLLAELDPAELRSRLDQAKANLQKTLDEAPSVPEALIRMASMTRQVFQAADGSDRKSVV